MRSLVQVGLAVITAVATGACGGGWCSAPLLAGSSNSLLDVSADGRLIACSNRDNGTVTVIDRETRKVLRELPVGHKPEGVSFIGDTHQLAVAVYAD
ncbi:MAG: hypothetical protein ACKOJF_04845, partial [Planctomycetaceae bacterium]